MSQQPDANPRLTLLLNRAAVGDAGATNELFPLVYEELRSLAAQQMASERAGHTLQPTALVNEAYLRLVSPEHQNWDSRAHFFGAAARAIRRILVDHARARNSRKRGGAKGRERRDLDMIDVAGETRHPLDLLALDEALEKLESLDPQKARLVELRYFAGLTFAETAETLGRSEASLARDWQFARAWLQRELSAEGT